MCLWSATIILQDTKGIGHRQSLSLSLSPEAVVAKASKLLAQLIADTDDLTHPQNKAPHPQKHEDLHRSFSKMQVTSRQ